MGRKSNRKRHGKASPVMQHALRSSPNWPLLVLSGIGILLTGYLAWTSFMGAAVKGCAAGGGCDVVLTSRWAILFGLPTAFWGLLAYAGIGGIAFVRRVDQHWSYAFSAAFFGFCYSVLFDHRFPAYPRSSVPVLPDVAHADGGHAGPRHLPAADRGGEPAMAGCASRPGCARVSCDRVASSKLHCPSARTSRTGRPDGPGSRRTPH